MTRSPGFAGLLLMLTWLGGCAALPDAPADPLIERVFDTTTGEELTREQLFDRMAAAVVVYVGELHDHPVHHRHHLEVVEALISRASDPAVGFERFSREETSYLMGFARRSARHGPDREAAAAMLREELGWKDPEDPYWLFYQPLLERIRESGLAAFGSDLPAPLRRRMTSEGVEGLSGVERRLVPVSDLEDDIYRQLMYEQFRAGHCGWGSEPYLSKLYDVWLARNEAMADAIVATLEQGHRPVVFLTGNAHTQYNMGVVERVAHRMPDARQINVGMQVVEASPVPLAHYLEPTVYQGREFGTDHPYLWLTERHRPLEPDPCAPFRRRQGDAGGDG